MTTVRIPLTPEQVELLKDPEAMAYVQAETERAVYEFVMGYVHEAETEFIYGDKREKQPSRRQRRKHLQRGDV